MNSVDYFKMSLMPISQTYAWHSLLNAKEPSDLYSITLQMSAFYGSWALWKIYGEGNKQEKAHFTMAVAFLSSLRQHRIATIVSTGLVVLNYAYPAALVLPMSTSKLAKIVGKGDFKDKPVPMSIQIWSFVFKAYFVTSIGFWSLLTYKFVQLD
mmetsp:Transcript_12236/g.35477  ORF Transcript_12236/g.35477 Transcript_12236/m.35477 type:complete len:154 (-) Transcript_12236:268-729(-)